ncbi:MAG: Amidase [Actinomycetia bacterium]|nr:Amidase [Actinomycetes bacterium]
MSETRSAGVSRRTVLRGAAVTAAAGTAVTITTATATAASAATTARAADYLPQGLDLETATVADLRPLLDSGQLTSEDLVTAYLERIKQLNDQPPALNAIRMISPVALDEARAADKRLQRARKSRTPYSPLLGIPVLIKDNIDATPMPTTAGSVALHNSHPAVDAPLAAALRKAGAVIIAKGNLTEFANYLTSGMPGGYSSLGGQVINAYDVSQTPSGSSSGPGVSASVGFATLTIGTETSGSILSPSAANSDVGIKPTTGLVPRTGIVPIAASQDTAGPIVKSVADAAALLTVITGTDPLDSFTAGNPLVGHDFTRDLNPNALQGARIGVVASQVPAAGTDNLTLWNAATAVLTQLGAVLVPVTLDTSSSIPGGSTVLSYEFKRDLNIYLSRLPAQAPMKTLADIIAYNTAHAGVALKFGQVLALASQAMDLSAGSADTVKYQADRAQDLLDSKGRIDALMSASNLTALLFANSGSAGIGAKADYPTISIPAGYQASNRRPFNIAFLGQAWSEPTLIGYAYAYEQATKLHQPPSALNPTLFS